MTYVKRLGRGQGARVWVRAGVALVALAAMLTIAVPRPGSAQEPCADYISKWRTATSGGFGVTPTRSGSGSRFVVLSVSRRRSWFRRLPGRRLAAGLSLLTLVSCNTPSSAPVGQAAFFTESDSAYAIRGLIAQLDINDERALFGSVASVVENADGGFVAIDALNQRLVFMDQDLNPVRTVGRQGEGPGEYQLPWVLVRDEDEFLVLDQGHARVTHLTASGRFVGMQQLGGFIRDVAIHPELGLLVAGMEFSGYYLSRVIESEQTPLAAKPAELRAEPSFFQLPNDLVAVTPDGRIHVFDGSRLALVSYDGAGRPLKWAYLPEEMRTALLEKDAKTTEAMGGPTVVLGSELGTVLQAFGDRRLFLRITYLDTIGFILDPDSLSATPVKVPEGPEWRWLRRTAIGLFDGKRLVVEGLEDGPAALAIVETELRGR